MHPATAVGRAQSLIFGTVQAWLDHRSSSKGAALAFYALFSVVPILLLLLSLGGMLYGQDAMQAEILQQLQNLIGPQGAGALRLLLAKGVGVELGSGTTIFATVFIWFGATSIFAELKGSFDEIWNVSSPANHKILNQILVRIISFFLVLILTLLMLMAFAANITVNILERHWHDEPIVAALLLVVSSSIISFAAVTLLFALIYKILPGEKISWRNVWIGSLFTSILFMAGKYAIGFYIGASDMPGRYGAAASLIAILLWVYYSSQIFLLGAEFTRQYAAIYDEPGLAKTEDGKALAEPGQGS